MLAKLGAGLVYIYIYNFTGVQASVVITVYCNSAVS